MYLTIRRVPGRSTSNIPSPADISTRGSTFISVLMNQACGLIRSRRFQQVFTARRARGSSLDPNVVEEHRAHPWIVIGAEGDLDIGNRGKRQRAGGNVKPLVRWKRHDHASVAAIEVDVADE